MDFITLFSPLDKSILFRDYGPDSVFATIACFGEKMPNYKNADMAILGICEERGTTSNKGCSKAPDEIRKKLYALKQGNQSCPYKIVDLGNLNVGEDLDETHARLGEVCRMLLENNVLPILLGGAHDLDYGQYRGYENMDKLISLLNVDAFIDLETASNAPFSSKHIQKILLHEPNYLFAYTHLAHQAYLITSSNMSFLDKLCFEAYRLGSLRNNTENIEPAVRGADMVSFDITALKITDAPGNANAQPFGLTGEEACQVCWYAGINEKLSSIGFYEYNPEKDDERKKTASVVATMVWYFIEGYYHRKNKKTFRGNDFIKYTVSMPVEPETLIFYKSKSTEKWWMEVTRYRSSYRYGRANIVPCSYKDYQVASQGNLPERYLSYVSSSP